MAPLQQDTIPTLLRGLIDDAAVFPPGNAPVSQALRRHQEYRDSWYASLVGPLLLPASKTQALHDIDDPLSIGLIADTGIGDIDTIIAQLPSNISVTQLEAVAHDREALRALDELARRRQLRAFAEIPLPHSDTEMLGHFDSTVLSAKFRTGGLRAAAFPSPGELAHALVECSQRGLSFKLTAGLHQAVRHTDQNSGFIHHGFLNVLTAAIGLQQGADVGSVTQTLEIAESYPLTTRLRGMLSLNRPLWAGFGSCSITEPLEDLIGLSLLTKPDKES